MKIEAEISEVVSYIEAAKRQTAQLVRVRWQVRERAAWKTENVVVQGSTPGAMLRAAAEALDLDAQA